MASVLKGNRIRLVDNRSFELPLPVKYELLKEDDRIAEYEIAEDERVTCRILTKYKEQMITPINRPLTIADIYYFFSSRVFQDKTPFTYTELSLLGLEKYNVYDIIRKTRGVTPYDTYWLRFDGDSCDYDTAYKAWNDFMTQTKSGSEAKAAGEKPAVSRDDPHVNAILSQHKVDVAAKFAASTADLPESIAEVKDEPVTNNTMSAEEIEALLLKSGLADVSEPEPEKHEEKPVEEKSSGGMMSQADIEAMLAAAGAPEPVSEVVEAVEAPVEEKPASGGKMSQADIEAMLAAAGAPEAVSEAASEVVEAVEETVEAAVEAPVEEKPAGGGKMSQADIEAMLAAASGAVEAAGEAVQETLEAPGEAVQETLEAPAPEPAPAPAEDKPAGGKMSQADIEAILNGMKEDAST